MALWRYIEVSLSTIYTYADWRKRSYLDETNLDRVPHDTTIQGAGCSDQFPAVLISMKTQLKYLKNP